MNIEDQGDMELHYNFNYIDRCNMCENPTTGNIVLGQRLNTSQGFSPKTKNGITTSVIKCKKCELIYSNPLPIPFNIQDHYKTPETYWTPEYFNYNSEYFSFEIQKAKELLAFKKGMKALDIGAGIGKAMFSLQTAGFDTYGIESSLAFRQKAIEKMKINPERLIEGMIEKMDFPENEFDFISFGAVLEHLYNPSERIINALKLLKPAGIIHIEIPSSRYLIPELLNWYYKLIGTNYVSNLSPMHEPFHLYEFGLKSFQEHSKNRDYEIVFYKYNVCEILFIPKIFHPALRWYMNRSNKGMQLTLFLRKKTLKT